MAFSIEIKQILKLVCNIKKQQQIAKAIQKKKTNKQKAGVIMLPGCKLYHILAITETACYWHKNRYIGQWNRIASTETNPCIHGQLIYDKGAKNIQWERIVSSISNGKIGE